VYSPSVIVSNPATGLLLCSLFAGACDRWLVNWLRVNPAVCSGFGVGMICTVCAIITRGDERTRIVENRRVGGGQETRVSCGTGRRTARDGGIENHHRRSRRARVRVCTSSNHCNTTAACFRSNRARNDGVPPCVFRRQRERGGDFIGKKKTSNGNKSRAEDKMTRTHENPTWPYKNTIARVRPELLYTTAFVTTRA